MAPKAPRGRKQQTKIRFSPAAPSSTTANMGNAPSQLEDSALEKPTPTITAPRKSSRAAKPARLDSSTEDGLVRNMRAGNTRVGRKLHTPVKREQNGMFDSSEWISAQSEGSGGEEEIQREPRAKPVSHKRQRETQAKPVSRKRQRAASGGDSDLERPAVTILPRKKQRIIKVSEESEEEEEEEQDEEEEDGEEEMVQVEETPKAHTRKREVRRHHTPEDTVEVQIQSRSARRRLARRPSPASDEDDVLVLPRPRRAKSARIQILSDEGSEAQSPPKSSRRKITRRRSDSDSENQDDEDDGAEVQGDDNDSEQIELKEDLAFLKSSPLADRGRLRSRHEKPKNERQKALEALKRKRAGTTEPLSSATPCRKKPVVIETDSDSELEIIKEEPESDGLIGEEVEDDDDPEYDEHEPNALDIFQEGEDDIGFIDDNADALIGEPTVNADLDDMRLAFSLSRAKTKDLFKHAVEWMVMKKIHPAFDSTHNLYTLTFRKLDDEVKGLAGSKFTSSAWTPDFTRAVRARPDLITNEIGGTADVMSPHCAACNRKNHPATWELMLIGQPYDKDTLDPLENNETSSDSDSDSDSSSLSSSPPRNTSNEKRHRDAAGEILPPESHRFFLGSTCKANAQVSHTLYHWRYHLYQWVKQYLAQQGQLTAEKLAKRDKSSNRKREKAAMKIVDKMEVEGEIKKLWRLYKEQVTFAVEASNEYKDGWGRR